MSDEIDALNGVIYVFPTKKTQEDNNRTVDVDSTKWYYSAGIDATN